MKTQAKKILVDSGIWYPLNLIRNVPPTFKWLQDGCRGVAPHPVKMMVVKSYLKRFSISNFVETGTYLGETLGYIAQTGVTCSSIELSQELYEAACHRFAKFDNVTLIQGDSSKCLPELLAVLDKPTLFWLDGHYSAGITAKADLDTPVSAELEAILAHPIKQHVILIDDMRCFDGTNDYPNLDKFLQKIREDGTYEVEVSADIIRLLPK
jgi:hypothetical protein